MGVNKVIFYGETLVDMSQVTVTPETLGKGETALDAKGDLITGTHECQETEPKLQSKTVTPTTSLQTVNPDSGYDGLSKVTVNAMPVATQATPSVSVSSAGLITATATQSAGYVSAGTKSGTKQLTTQAAQTITPGTSDKTIASGRYLTGTQTIKGDANLVAGNIKSGVSIFGVEGTHAGGGSDGGGAQVATGSFTPTNADFKNNPIAITGLGFRPKYVDIMLEATVAFPAAVGNNTIGLYWYDSMGDTSIYINLGLTELTVSGVHYIKAATINHVEKSLGVVVGDDGFTLQSSRADYKIQLAPYRYVAIG